MTRTYHKEILQIAFPSILSNITVPLLGLADMTIAGHLGTASYIGAIAIGSTIFNMIYWIFAFLRMGTSGMTSQAFGANNRQEILHLLQRSLTTSGLLSATIILLQSPILHAALLIMAPDENVTTLSSEYFRICVWGAPAVLGLYSLTGWFIGMQNAKYPLYVAIVQNITNIAVSLFLVFGLHLNVSGIAWGTLIAQYTGFILSILCCRRLCERIGVKGKFIVHEVLRKNDIKRFFSVNRDIFLRTLCLVGVTLYFTSAGSRQGEYILATNALLMQYFTLYSYFMDGFAFAGEALAGKCIGAKNHNGLQYVIKALFLWGMGVALCFTALYGMFGEYLMTLLTDEPEVIHTAMNYLPWVILIPFAGLCAFIWDGVFIGLTATRYMLVSMFCAMVVFFTANHFMFPVWNNHALWLAFLLYLFTRGLVQQWLYKKKMNPNL